MRMTNEQTGLGCLALVLVVLLAVTVSIAIGIFFGAGWCFLALAAFILAGIGFVALEFARSGGGR